MWRGEILEINAAPQPDHEEPESEIVSNTQPTVKP
jgi:hypothetical protein